MQVNIAILCYISPNAEAESADNIAVLASHIMRTEARYWLRAGATVRIGCPQAQLRDDDPLRAIVTAEPLPLHADVWVLHATPDVPVPIDAREIRHGIVVAHAHQLDTLPAELRAADIILTNTPASHQRALTQDAAPAHWLGMPAWPPPRSDERDARRAELRPQLGLVDDASPLALVWLPDGKPKYAIAWTDVWEEVALGQAQAVTRNRLALFLRDLPAADVCVVAGDDDIAQFAALTAAAWGIPVTVTGAADAYSWLTGIPTSSIPETLAAWLRDPVQRGAAGRKMREAAAAFVPAAWQARLSRLMQQAQEHSVPLPALPTPAVNDASNPPRLATDYAHLNKQADVMLRGYTVRSRAPLVGRLIAWIRRNLTSHLREPYLDPTLERQVAFNRAMVQALSSLEQRAQQAIQAAQVGSGWLPAQAQQLAGHYAQLVSHLRQGEACHVAGAGDGLLLPALRAAGIEPRGCDPDPAVAVAAQMRGFSVRHAPAFDYLRSLPARTCDTVIITVDPARHAPADVLLLSAEARRALKSGGRLALLLNEITVSLSQQETYERGVELRALLQAAGFRVIATQIAQPAPTPTDESTEQTENATVEARLDRIEQALFEAWPPPVWVIGQIE